MPATLRVERRSVGMALVELHRSTFQVLLDGQQVGTVDRANPVLEVPCIPGRHRLQVRSGRYRSANRSFDVTDGHAVDFRCTGAIFWPRFLASLAKPDLALVLQPVEQ